MPGAGPLFSQAPLWIPVNADGDLVLPEGVELAQASRIGSLETETAFSAPFGLAVDADGNLYVADSANHQVRKVDPEGNVTTFAGTGQFGSTGGHLNFPAAVAVDAAGSVYIAERRNHRIRKVDSGGAITTVAGTGRVGHGGDGGPATEAFLFDPIGVAVDAAGNVYVADRRNHRIRKIDTAGTITTYAGTGEPGSAGDGGSATAASLAYPAGVAVDTAGNVYVADMGNGKVRKIDAVGTITTFAGTGDPRTAGDGGPATEASLAYPAGLAVDSAGNVYVADMGSGRVRRIDAAGTITTIAGAGDSGTAQDGGPATRARLAYPAGVAAASDGKLYVSEFGGARVRILTPDSSYIGVELGDSGEHYLLETSEDGFLMSGGVPLSVGDTVLAGNGDRYVLSQLESGILQAQPAPLLAIPRGRTARPACRRARRWNGST